MEGDKENKTQKPAPKRSLTPNRALFDSYDEAHRTIARYPVFLEDVLDEEFMFSSLLYERTMNSPHGVLEEKTQPQTTPAKESMASGKENFPQATKTEEGPSPHYDDIKKRNAAQSGFEVTPLSGRGSMQPLGDACAPSPVLPPLPPRREGKDKCQTFSQVAERADDQDDKLHSLAKGRKRDFSTGGNSDPGDPFGGFKTNSDHSISDIYDGFETDRKYSFLCSPAEKEVSSALREVIGISQPSSGQLLRFRDDRTPSTPAFDTAKFASRLREEKQKQAERNKQGGGFYNSSAIDSAWHMSDTEIKIPTSPFPIHSSDLGTPEPREPWSHIDLRDGGNDSPWTAMPATSSVAGHAQDWVTVSEEQQDDPLRTPAVSMGRVLTGSSVANYSDHVLIANRPESIPIHDPRAINHNLMPWWDKLPSAGVPSQASRTGPPTQRDGKKPVSVTRQDSCQSGLFPFNPRGGVQGALSKLSSTGRQSKYERFDDQQGLEMQPLPTEKRQTSRNPFRRGQPRPVTSSTQTAADDNSQAPLFAARPLSNYEHLHFPLVALQDAQRIQGYRRASGLEDQTTSGRSVRYQPMVARGSQRTLLLTPPPRTYARTSSLYSTDLPSPSLHGGETARSSYYGNPLRQNPTMVSGMISGSAYERRPGNPAADRLSRRSAHLTGGLRPRPHLTTRSMTRRYQEGTDPELGRLAGSESSYRRHRSLPLSPEAQKRQTFFFLLTVIIDVPLPFWGLAVLYGKMDSAVSWCTKGEAYGLTERHRG
ncbi:hypothetical protein VD0002_g6095 [Verticillium dahliae]|uniref:Uncharacterized protein n=1 Tax=Verticillium dahliae TaxID=27337 RepID=A0A2J8EJU5_VERDA|nr:hypothetical protein VdG2_09501 [Verticillium dahliae VDG2]KAH6697645.1 hypothetical protein EV126DRAFT_515109 [Verticillium dahliae]PNH35962.1 hypothetical protein BJF96_g880 [Verticillium dahliae]PNH49793.1 hypothetical protein VD0003_g7366 [Verticillium dahliae]PNH61791.1 hypothetical protein VD0002_g6095 [Verticillium dahliae]